MDCTLTVDWDTPIGKVKSITTYAQVTTDNRIDFDCSYIPSSYSTALLCERTFQQAVDLTVNKIGNLDLIIGATYFHDNLKNLGTKQYTGNNPASHCSGTASNSTYAPMVEPRVFWGHRRLQVLSPLVLAQVGGVDMQQTAVGALRRPLS